MLRFLGGWHTPAPWNFAGFCRCLVLEVLDPSLDQADGVDRTSPAAAFFAALLTPGGPQTVTHAFYPGICPS